MDSSSSDVSGALGGLLGVGVLCYILFIIVFLVAAVYVYYKIFAKTGNSGWLALLMFVPLVNIGMFLYLAFSDWPVLKENRDLKARLGGGYAPQMPTYAPPPAPTYAPQAAPPVQPYYAPPAPPVAPPAPPAAPPAEAAPPAPPAEPPAQP